MKGSSKVGLWLISGYSRVCFGLLGCTFRIGVGFVSTWFRDLGFIQGFFNLVWSFLGVSSSLIQCFEGLLSDCVVC